MGLTGLLGRLMPSPLALIVSTEAKLSTSCVSLMPSCRKYKSREPGPRTGTNPHSGKKFQEWWDWDGYGPYKYRHHHYPNNITLRDVQRRRIFKKFNGEREKLNAIIRNDLLPKELQENALHEKNHNLPLDSSKNRPNFRCAVTGRARGNYFDFRVSRFIFRHEADHNRVSGVQRAFWLHNTIIKP